MGVFLLFLLFMVGIPALVIIYSVKAGKKAAHLNSPEKPSGQVVPEMLKKPLPFINRLLERGYSKFFHTTSLDNRPFLKGITHGVGIGIYVLSIILASQLLGMALGYVDPSGAGGIVWIQIILVSVAGSPWIMILIDWFPTVLNPSDSTLLIVSAVSCIMFNAILLGVAMGLWNLYKAKYPLTPKSG